MLLVDAVCDLYLISFWRAAGWILYDKIVCIYFPVPPNMLLSVERLDWKRPILWLASSEILTPHPPQRPPPLVRGEDTLAGWRGGWGSIVWKTQGTALYSTYVSTLCFYPSKIRVFRRALCPPLPL